MMPLQCADYQSNSKCKLVVAACRIHCSISIFIIVGYITIISLMQKYGPPTSFSVSIQFENKKSKLFFQTNIMSVKVRGRHFSRVQHPFQLKYMQTIFIEIYYSFLSISSQSGWSIFSFPCAPLFVCSFCLAKKGPQCDR